MAENQNPVEQHIEQDAAEHDPKRGPRTRLALQIIPRGRSQPRRDEGPRHDNGVGLGLFHHALRLSQVMKEGVNEMHAEGAQEAANNRQSDARVIGPCHGMGHASTVRVRDAHRNGGQHAESGDGHDHEHIIAEGAGSQRERPDVSDHDCVGHAHEHLSDLTRGDRRGQTQGRA